MAKGGKRQGAGRPRGSKTKRTVELAKQIAESGLSPLAYMLTIMRDKTADKKRRDEMAKSAAPYQHPKLANIEHSGPEGGPVQHHVTVSFVE